MRNIDGDRTYIAIDLKSFFASVECVDRGMDPLTTNLLVADMSRTDKTICLAVSPSLKSYGIPGRPRLFEVVQKLREVKARTGQDVSYIVAPPRMARYIEYSTRVYQVYLRFVAPEDIHVYSIDEVFMDVTPYLKTYRLTPRELAMKMIQAVLKETGITATAGIGTNLYLCKIAMDIVAKHIPADKDGVRIAELNELTYRQLLWNHRPLTDFWRVGGGIARKLAMYGIYTMGQLARLSLTHEPLLFKLFGVNAELLIDHAWGYEPCTIDMVKAYRPETNSLSNGQVLTCAYAAKQARVVAQEMADNLSLDLVDKHLVTDQLTLTIGYDVESLTNPAIRNQYRGEIVTDHYGRPVPRHAHGTINLRRPTSSSVQLNSAIKSLFDRIVNPTLLIRRLTVTANRVVREELLRMHEMPVQLTLFQDEEGSAEQAATGAAAQRERLVQEAMLSLKKRFGKNSVLKGLNFADGATAKERNQQIGGHKA
jgi:DNA polymerase V